MRISPSRVLELFPAAPSLISGGAASMWLVFRSLDRSQSRISAGSKCRWLIICCETAKTTSYRPRGLPLFRWIQMPD
jgi:hypothetical protein